MKRRRTRCACGSRSTSRRCRHPPCASSKSVRDAIDRNDLPAALGYAIANREVKAEIDAFNKAVAERFGERKLADQRHARDPSGKVFDTLSQGLTPAEKAEACKRRGRSMRTVQQLAAHERSTETLKQTEKLRLRSQRPKTGAQAMTQCEHHLPLSSSTSDRLASTLAVRLVRWLPGQSDTERSARPVAHRAADAGRARVGDRGIRLPAGTSAEFAEALERGYLRRGLLPRRRRAR